MKKVILIIFAFIIIGCEDRIQHSEHYIVTEKITTIRNLEWRYTVVDLTYKHNNVTGIFYLNSRLKFKVGDTITFKKK